MVDDYKQLIKHHKMAQYPQFFHALIAIQALLSEMARLSQFSVINAKPAGSHFETVLIHHYTSYTKKKKSENI